MKNLRIVLIGSALFGLQVSVAQADILDEFIYADQSEAVLAVGGDPSMEKEVDFAAFTEEDKKDTDAAMKTEDKEAK